MSFEEALNLASRDDGFKATVYAMNTLLIHKGVYTQEEFQKLFVEWVGKNRAKIAGIEELPHPTASSTTNLEPLLIVVNTAQSYNFAHRSHFKANMKLWRLALLPPPICHTEIRE